MGRPKHGATRTGVQRAAPEVLGALALAAVFSVPSWTQSPTPQATAPQNSPAPNGRPGRRGPGMGRVGGEVTAIAGNTLTLKAENGRSEQVVLTDNTRVMKDRGPVKVSDLHVGDGLFAFGNMDPETHVLHAAVVMATDAAELKSMRDNLGKTYITGRVTAVDLDDARMTVERPDHVAQTIAFDESTSFKRAIRRPRSGNPGEAAEGEEGRGGIGGGIGSGGGMGSVGGMGLMSDSGALMDRAFASGESITLADIKVGDNVVGTGGLKKGTFVPTRLLESPPRPHGMRGAGETGQPGSPAGSAPDGSPGPGVQ